MITATWCEISNVIEISNVKTLYLVLGAYPVLNMKFEKKVASSVGFFL